MAVCLAIVSSFKNQVGKAKTAVFGEVGLTGEIRAVGFSEQRVREAVKLGFETCIIPVSNANTSKGIQAAKGVADLSQALLVYLGNTEINAGK